MCFARLANPALVPEGQITTEASTHDTEAKHTSSCSSFSSRDNTSSSFQTSAVGLPLISKTLDALDLSSSAHHLILASLRPSTLKQYKPHLVHWETYCVQNKIQPLQPSVENVAEFLAHLFHSGFSYSALLQDRLCPPQ